MASYREIVTKAVLGKGKKTFIHKNSIDAKNKPTTVLGCWVINHVLISSDNLCITPLKNNQGYVEYFTIRYF